MKACSERFAGEGGRFVVLLSCCHRFGLHNGAEFGIIADAHKRQRDVAQPGSALPWGGRGPGFKSRHSDQ